MTQSSSQSTSRSPGRFDGWQVVLAIFIIMTGSSGLGFYNMSVFLNALVREGGYTVSFASTMTTLFFLVGALVGLLVGRIIDRHDPRYIMAGGALMAATGMVVVGRAEGETVLALGYVLFAMGFISSGLIPCTTIIARRFVRRRAIVLSIASTGLSVGGIVLTPMSAALIADHGLANAMPWLAGLYVLFVAPTALLMPRNPPPRIDRDSRRADGIGSVVLEGIPFAQALRGRYYIMMTGAFTLGLMAQVGGMAHHFNLASERVGLDFAAIAVAILAGSSMTGRWIGGWLLEYFSIRAFTLAMMMQQCLGLILLGQAQGMAGLVLITILFGVTIGNVLMLLPLTVGEVFGLREYGKLYATAQSTAQLGLAIGPALIGFLYENAGGYPMPYMIMGGISVLGAGLLLLTGPAPLAGGQGNSR